MNKKMALSIIVSFIVASTLVLTVLAATTVTTTINTSGTIVVSPNIGVYSNSACTTSITSLSWGSLSPGKSVTQTVYVKNIQGSTSLTLSLAASNWNPTSANGPLTLSWNKQGTVLASGQSTAATITLTASSTITGITTFSFQIAISATS